MGVAVAGNCLHWSQPSLHRCSSSSQPNFASLFSAKRRGIDSQDLCQIGLRSSPFLGASPTKLLRRSSLNDLNPIGRRSKDQSFPRAFSASLDGIADDDDEEADDEFMRRLQELGAEINDQEEDVQSHPDCRSQDTESISSVRSDTYPSAEPPWPAICPEPPKWLNGSEIVPASVEMRANSMDLPLSLRIIKRKKQCEGGGVKEGGEAAYCSIKKAFSSMVFIVRELQSYTLQMREVLFYQNLQGILARVQAEMNASFVWLFQQIFSCTPTLMVYVMLLLANFTVYSIGHNSAIAAVSPSPAVTVEQEYQQTQHRQQNSRFDASSVKSFSVGRMASVGGNGGGGGKAKPVAGATDDGRSDGGHTIVPADGISRVGIEEEETAWNRIVEEASRMQASLTLMDPDMLRQLVSPVSVEVQQEDYAVYSQTELRYHKALSQDPDNLLLLCNFAQFLFVALHDLDRAEYYFKRAVEKQQPADADALYKYGTFLWIARKDLEAAEEAYVRALDADPGNPHYAASYAHFLWNTGGEDTCYPLDGSDAC